MHCARQQYVIQDRTKAQQKGIEKKWLHDRRLVDKGHFINLYVKYSKNVVDISLLNPSLQISVVRPLGLCVMRTFSVRQSLDLRRRKSRKGTHRKS